MPLLRQMFYLSAHTINFQTALCAQRCIERLACDLIEYLCYLMSRLGNFSLEKEKKNSPKEKPRFPMDTIIL